MYSNFFLSNNYDPANRSFDDDKHDTRRAWPKTSFNNIQTFDNSKFFVGLSLFLRIIESRLYPFLYCLRVCRVKKRKINNR